MTSTVLDWMVEDAQRLAECRHDHPFAVLGPQPLQDGSWVVRVWMPEARSVTLLAGGQEVPTQTPHHPWIFEASLSHDPGCSYTVR
ncbi:MAG: 1,4-alpha-glucan branching enzyme, partial [Synechococcaceae bacterium WB9_4xB_025]|nr:1,4-alpha-glucan branching enzyme [Synechococcaceae bacterium WB9_4xB_025]